MLNRLYRLRQRVWPRFSSLHTVPLQAKYHEYVLGMQPHGTPMTLSEFCKRTSKADRGVPVLQASSMYRPRRL